MVEVEYARVASVMLQPAVNALSTMQSYELNFPSAVVSQLILVKLFAVSPAIDALVL